MKQGNDGLWQQMEAIAAICAQLAVDEEDTVRMFAQRVDALARAFQDSLLAPPSVSRGAGDD